MVRETSLETGCACALCDVVTAHPRPVTSLATCTTRMRWDTAVHDRPFLLN
jgi:hypothetical protein